MNPPGKEAAVAQQWLSKTLGKLTLCWAICKQADIKKNKKQPKKPLLTFGKTGQETNIYILGAFGWVVFFVEGEFFLEAEGCRKNTNCYWNRAELWETDCLQTDSVSSCTGLSEWIWIWSVVQIIRKMSLGAASVWMMFKNLVNQPRDCGWKYKKKKKKQLIIQTIHLYFNL